jgi:hypothetical protein
MVIHAVELWGNLIMQFVRVLNQVSHELTCPRSSDVYISPSLGYFLFSCPLSIDDLPNWTELRYMAAVLFPSKVFKNEYVCASAPSLAISLQKETNRRDDMRTSFLRLLPAQKPTDNPQWLVPSEEMLGDRKDNHTSHVRRLEDILLKTKPIRLDWMSASPGAVLTRQGREIRQDVPGSQDSLFASKPQAYSGMWTLVCSGFSKSMQQVNMLLLLGFDPLLPCKVREICRVTSVSYSSLHIGNSKTKQWNSWPQWDDRLLQDEKFAINMVDCSAFFHFQHQSKSEGSRLMPEKIGSCCLCLKLRPCNWTWLCRWVLAPPIKFCTSTRDNLFSALCLFLF